MTTRTTLRIKDLLYNTQNGFGINLF